MHSTNAHSQLYTLAQHLQAAKHGTFTGLITKKAGQVKRGLRYGDDLVHVVIVTGFDYPRLVQRSLDILSGNADRTILNEDVLATIQARGLTGKDGADITLADVQKGRRALVVSLSKSHAGINKATHANYFDPLMWDGEEVVGVKVYNGVGDAAPKGTIYLQGLKIAEKVMEEAEHGPVPVKNQRGDVVAKQVLTSMLPVGRYVQYRLEPGADYILNVGGQAALAADQSGVAVNQDAVTTAQQMVGG